MAQHKPIMNILDHCKKTNTVWLNLLQRLIQEGETVHTRGKTVLELRGMQTRIPMSAPVITIERRKLGYKFMPGEAHWILSGSNVLENIAQYSKRMLLYSDDGVTLFGAYGPKIWNQLKYVVDALKQDLQTRQAVINIWRENPPASRDIPCTLSLQFLVRNGKMDCIANMRSSDAWLGWPYDVFSFSMVAAYVCLMLKQEKVAVLSLGQLILNAGSSHLYEENYADAGSIIHHIEHQTYWTYRPMCLYDFNHPDDLRQHLGLLAQADKTKIQHPFLSELPTLKQHDQPTKNDKHTG